MHVVVRGTTWIKVSVTPCPPDIDDDAVTVTATVDVTLKHVGEPQVVRTGVCSFAVNPMA